MKKWVFPFFVIFCFLFSFFLRLTISLFGHNPDLESWLTVSNIVRDGKIVYIHTMWYNYGPTWSYIVGLLAEFLYLFFGYVRDMHFHLLVAGFLGLVDVLIALTLMRYWHKYAGILYILNPISILISGFHSQFDNFAVLVGLWSWILFWRFLKDNSIRFLVLSAVFLGISLTIKHILFFFPLWILFLFWYQKRSLRHFFLFSLIVYGVFFGGFIIEIIRNPQQELSVIDPIIKNVFQYKGSYGKSAYLLFINLFYPTVFFEYLFNFVPVLKGYTFMLFLMLVFSGILFTRKLLDYKQCLFYYLVIVFTFSPMISDQYLVIPLMAIVYFYRNVFSVLFLIIGSIYLLIGPSANLSNFIEFGLYLDLGIFQVPFFPWNIIWQPTDLQVQGWMLLFSFYLIIKNLFQFKIELANLFLLRQLRLINILFNRYIFLVLTLFFLLVNISIGVFSYQFLINRWDMTISVKHSYYGKNCQGRGVDATHIAEQSCNGKRLCEFPISFKDPAPDCGKNFYIEWYCGNNGLVNGLSFVKIDTDATGGVVKLGCPTPKYFKSAIDLGI